MIDACKEGILKLIKEYELERETAKNKYLCVVGNKIEDVRKNNMIVHWIDDLYETNLGNIVMHMLW